MHNKAPVTNHKWAKPPQSLGVNMCESTVHKCSAPYCRLDGAQEELLPTTKDIPILTHSYILYMKPEQNAKNWTPAQNLWNISLL